MYLYQLIILIFANLKPLVLTISIIGDLVLPAGFQATLFSLLLLRFKACGVSISIQLLAKLFVPLFSGKFGDFIKLWAHHVGLSFVS